MNKLNESYDLIYQKSIDPSQRELFWSEQSTEISWFNPPKTILSSDTPPFYKWFPDGEVNICYNCLDRHYATNPDTNAIIWESYYLKKTTMITYRELYALVNKLALILLSHGIVKGDRVIIYMPMIPEGIISMLACCRIGAVHSVVFGGFAADELAERIIDAKPKMIITASCGIEPRRMIPYYPIVKKAIESARKEYDCTDVHVMIIQRPEALIVKSEEIDHANTSIYNEEMKALDNKGDIYVKPVVIKGSDIFFILYTSGTSGQPKGIVRDAASIVSINYTMKTIMNISQGDVVFSTSDYGWIVGHVFIVYGPLLRGATTTIFEGKPVNTPNSAKCWEIIQKYNVKAFYTSPTALRAIKREDPSYSLMHQYNLSSLESIHLSGERCDPETYTWIKGGLFSNNKAKAPHFKLVNDQWWQTESGWPICCNNISITQHDISPGIAGPPLMGYSISVLDEEYIKELPPKATGRLCIKLPMPPGFMTTLFNNDNAFVKKYITNDKRYYIPGDIGYKDEKGFICVLGRDDDMIKIAGHRLSTGKIEEVLMKIKHVVEAAVVSKRDELKGEIPIAFIVCVKDSKVDYDSVKNEAKMNVIESIGRICALYNVVVCEKLPKTRSGKIIRKILKQIVNNDQIYIPPTIEDVDSVKNVTIAYSKAKL